MSSIIINIGETGNGKNERTIMWMNDEIASGDKNELGEPFDYYVVDPAKEYARYPNLKQINPFEDIKGPLKMIKHSRVFVDEAQIYFKLAASQAELLETISLCRHNHITAILNFSAIQLIPVYIQLYINQIWLGHTNDSIDACKGFGKWENPMRAAMKILEKNTIKAPFAAIYLDKTNLAEYSNIFEQMKKGAII